MKSVMSVSSKLKVTDFWNNHRIDSPHSHILWLDVSHQVKYILTIMGTQA